MISVVTARSVEWSEAELDSTLRRPLRRFRALYEEFGDMFRVDVAGRHYLFAFDVESNRAVLTAPNVFGATECGQPTFLEADRLASRRLALGLLSMDGPKHAEHRRTLLTAFNAEQLKRYREVAQRIVEDSLSHWHPGEERDLLYEMRRLACATTLRILFGIDDSAQAERLGARLAQFADALFTQPEVSLTAFPLSDTLAESLEEELYRLVVDARAGRVAEDSVLAVLCRPTGADGACLSDRDIVAHCLTLYIAGFESTASAVTWALFLIIQHPGVATAVLREIRQVADGHFITSSTGVVQRAIKESLRLFPPALWIKRVTRRSTELGANHLEPGTTVILSPFITHRLPRLFDDPARFDPERWRVLKPSPFEYLPFGAGPRSCIGSALVLQQLQVIIISIMSQFTLTVRPYAHIDRGMTKQDDREVAAVPVQLSPREANFRRVPVVGNVCDLVDMM